MFFQSLIIYTYLTILVRLSLIALSLSATLVLSLTDQGTKPAVPSFPQARALLSQQPLGSNAHSRFLPVPISLLKSFPHLLHPPAPKAACAVACLPAPPAQVSCHCFPDLTNPSHPTRDIAGSPSGINCTRRGTASQAL